MMLTNSWVVIHERVQLLISKGKRTDNLPLLNSLHIIIVQPTTVNHALSEYNTLQ